MSQVIKCDWCGQTSRANAVVNWFVLEGYGMTVRLTSDDPEPRHFCSVSCIGEWAACKEDGDREERSASSAGDADAR